MILKRFRLIQAITVDLTQTIIYATHCDPSWQKDPTQSGSGYAARKEPDQSLTPVDGRRSDMATNLDLVQVKPPQIFPLMAEM